MVDTKCSRLPKGSCRVGRKGRIAQKRREAGLTRNLPGDRRNGDGCAGGTRRSPPGLQPPLTDSCGVNTLCPRGGCSSLLGVGEWGPGSRSSSSLLNGINPGKDTKAVGISSKGRGEAGCAQRARCNNQKPLLGLWGFLLLFFGVYLLVLKLTTSILLLNCHGTARALKSLETPVPKRDPKRCAAARHGSQPAARRPSPMEQAAGAPRARGGGGRGRDTAGRGQRPRCKSRTVWRKPFCLVHRPQQGWSSGAAPRSSADPLPTGGGLGPRSAGRRKERAAAASPTAPPAPHHRCYRPPHPPDTTLRGEAGGDTCAQGRRRGPGPSIPSLLHAAVEKLPSKTKQRGKKKKKEKRKKKKKEIKRKRDSPAASGA
ncbi:uncharacterized protein [Heliangelus exortis]|uniref:uncharacterized protein isoform X1 n=1 Tax=Heliangelus exortis TaxID=472823 RepID=UPI003A910110